MRLLLDRLSSISHGMFYMKPGWNEIDDALWEKTLVRSKYVRTLVHSGKIRESGDSDVEYDLNDLNWNAARDMIEETMDADVLLRWVKQENARKNTRDSVTAALAGRLATLES